MSNTELAVVKTPAEWEKVCGITVVDPDGWDRGANFWQSWAQPITEVDFRARASVSTCMPSHLYADRLEQS